MIIRKIAELAAVMDIKSYSFQPVSNKHKRLSSANCFVWAVSIISVKSPPWWIFVSEAYEGLADTYSAKKTSLLVFCSRHLCLCTVTRVDGMITARFVYYTVNQPGSDHAICLANSCSSLRRRKSRVAFYLLSISLSLLANQRAPFAFPKQLQTHWDARKHAELSASLTALREHSEGGQIS